MRVAVVNWSSRRVGGIEDYVSILLPALRRAGTDVAFWHEKNAPLDRLAIDLPPGVPEYCAAEMGADASLRALREWKPDVVYVQMTHDVDLERRLLDIAPAVVFLHTYVGTCISGGKTFTRPTVIPCSRRFGPPCLAHYFPHGCGGNNPLTMMRLYNEQSERLRLLGRYRAILTHSEHMRQEMAKHGLNAQLVPFPVDAQTRHDTRPGDGTWRLLYAGRMESIKGGSVLIEAIPSVLESVRRPIRVIMAGDGRDRPRWEAHAREIEKSMPNAQFEFTGWLAQDEVAILMKNSDLLVVPSLWPEPFGSVGPAAGQHGLPAAAFAVGGIPQWLLEGVTGHLAPGDPPTPAGLARAILQCLEDPLHYTALREGARQMGGTFTMERHLPELMKVLARV
jgi:glycosyltransferase involved in cell wall biosynthesis